MNESNMISLPTLAIANSQSKAYTDSMVKGLINITIEVTDDGEGNVFVTLWPTSEDE